jgi:uracil-DNA glycosylase
MDTETKKAMLAALREEYKNCGRCPLSAPVGRGRQRVVMGEGNPDARVLFVADAPGYLSEQYGRVMMEEYGTHLWQYLEGVESSPEEVYITYLTACRATVEDNPRKERAPTEGEIDACWSRLSREIEIVDPYVVVCLGEKPYKALTGCPKSLLQTARDGTIPMLWAETQGRFLTTRRSAYGTFDPGYLLKKLEESGPQAFWRNGSDAHHTFKTIRTAFAVADMQAHLNYGTPIPNRGD